MFCLDRQPKADVYIYSRLLGTCLNHTDTVVNQQDSWRREAFPLSRHQSPLCLGHQSTSSMV